MAGLKGKVIAVNVSKEKGVSKNNIGKARLIEELGLENDAHAAPGIRQVSLLAWESVEKMIARGLKLDAGDFAENITTKGIPLETLPVGTVLSIGGEVVLEITQIGKKCHKGCAIMQQVGDCIMPREGIFARVIKGGFVEVGQDIIL